MRTRINSQMPCKGDTFEQHNHIKVHFPRNYFIKSIRHRMYKDPGTILSIVISFLFIHFHY